MAYNDRSLDLNCIRNLLLEENNEEPLPDDASSEEEDIVEKDDVQNSDSANEETDDSDEDPDWNPNNNQVSRLELICRKRKKRRYLEVCDGDSSSDNPDDPQSFEQLETPVLIDPQPIETPPTPSPPTLPPNSFYGQQTSQGVSSSEHNLQAANFGINIPREFEELTNRPSISSTGVLHRGRSRTRARSSTRGRPTIRGRSTTLHNNDRGRNQTSTNSNESTSTATVEPPVSLVPSEADPLILVPNTQVIRGKDRTPWSTSAPQRQNVPARNIVYVRPGPQNNARNAITPRECFELFFTPEMVSIIVTHTNEQILRVRNNYAEKTSTTAPVNDVEMFAFFGILLFSATMKNNHLSSKDMFDPKLCGSRYRAVMSKERFDFLCFTLRFDDKETRVERSTTDPLAPIRQLWDLFVANCRDSYKPGPYITIDEQLLAFRGKCRFRMYIPNKPAKYGLKIVMACDTSTNYMFNAIPYVGKKTFTDNLPVAEYMVKELTRPVHGSNRNVTCDNWFTSIKLVDDLLRPPYNLTYVGTVRSNKKELPKELKNDKARPVGTSVFCFGSEKTLVSYKPKSNKVVLLISTMHDSAELHPETKKPTIIHSYNKTKGAVDTLDQMCHNVSCSRKTRRWPLCMFYGMQNITYINAYVIYCLKTYSRNGTPMNRRKFNLKLCDQLVFPHMRNRLSNPHLQRNLRSLISDFLGIPMNPERQPHAPLPRKTCFYCPSVKRRMTTTYCNHCNQPICAEHKATCCVQCDQEK